MDFQKLFKGRYPARGTFPVAANTLIKRGDIVQINASGYAIPGAASNGFRAVGVADSEVNNLTGSDNGGAAGAVDIEVEYGIFEMTLTGSAILPGDAVYVAGPQSVTATPGTNGPAGFCHEIRGTTHYFYFAPMSSGIILEIANQIAAIPPP